MSFLIGKPAPSFEGIALVDGEFKNIKNEDYLGKYVILFFYPCDFTFVCPTEIIAFNDRLNEFQNIGAQIISCSTDTQYCHIRWTKMSKKEGGIEKIDFPMLADRNQSITKAYGILAENGNAYRGLFVINREGLVCSVTVNDMPVGRNVDETLRVVTAFQYFDVHGEVCPANWRSGNKTIKPTVNDSKGYFESN